jgi:hypothetical protein
MTLNPYRLAEGAVAHRMFEILVGGGHDTYVYLDPLGSPDAHDLALLEGTQDLHLEVAFQVPDFVQEERGTGGLFEESDLSRDRARKRSALVTKKLRFQEALGKGGDVHRVEGPAAAVAFVMEGARHQLLAGAALRR